MGLMTWLGRSSQLAGSRRRFASLGFVARHSTRASLGLRVAARQAAYEAAIQTVAAEGSADRGIAGGGGVVAGESLSVGRGRWAVRGVTSNGGLCYASHIGSLSGAGGETERHGYRPQSVTNTPRPSLVRRYAAARFASRAASTLPTMNFHSGR